MRFEVIMKKGAKHLAPFFIFKRRGKRIRTFDPLLPKQVR